MPHARSYRKTLLIALALTAACRQAPPTTPAPLELIGVLRNDSALNGAHDVEVRDGIAYVAGKGGNLAIIDVSNPTAPALLSSIVDASLIEDAETVLPVGDVLLLGARDLFAIDVSDPRKPTILEHISDRPKIDRINGMISHKGLLFTANKTGWIGVFDIRDPKQPKYLDAFDAGGRGEQPKTHGIARWGDKVVAVSTQQGAGYQVRIYEPFDSAGKLLPSADWVIGPGVQSAANAFDLDGANRVAVRGDLAIIGAFAPDRMAVVDLEHAKQLANMPVCDIDATGLEVVGDIAFVSGGECVEAVDISRPDNPVSIAQFRKGELFPTRQVMQDDGWHYDNGHDLVYRDGLLYVTAQLDNRLGILRVNDEKILALAGR
jgi:hypothetical protein